MHTIVLHRWGTFTIGNHQHHPLNEATQCGHKGLHHYSFNVAIKGTELTLDADGFIIDNLRVEEYFEEKYTLNTRITEIPSCERIALKACEDLKALVPLADGVRVTIAGALGLGRTQHAKVSAFWERGA